MSIIKSPNDHREYHYEILDNKMKVFYVHDPNLKSSAVSLAVNIGSNENPVFVLGLAHYLEHMLFMGSEKYPEENYYSKFLSENGGHSNAFTASDMTNYFHLVNSEKFLESLDIFSRFFIDPLMKESSLRNEMKAVNSEHEKNIQNDTWRYYRVMEQMLQNSHPEKRFSTGNTETLDQPDIRDKLFKFYNKWYSSNLMTLVLVTNLKIDDIKDKIRDIFSQVKNKDVEVPRPPLYFDSSSPKAMELKNIRDQHSLTFLWEVPESKQYFDVSPTHYLSHLLGHETKGSIYHYLYERQLINSLYASEFLSSNSSSTLAIVVDLTDKGFANMGLVVDCVNKYVNMLVTTGFNQKVYEELVDMGEINFNFKEFRSDVNNAVDYTEKLLHYPPEMILAVGRLLSKDISKAKEVITLYLNALKIESKQIISSPNIDGTKTDYYYQTEYNERDLVKPEFTDFYPSYPFENKYLPSPLWLENNKNVSVSSSTPVMKLSNFEEWEASDSLAAPKVGYGLIFDFGDELLDPILREKLIFYTGLAMQSLNEDIYFADLAGIYGNLSVNNNLILSLTGFNEKMDIFLKTLLERLLFGVDDKDLFEHLKKDTIKSLRNNKFSQPYVIANQITSKCLLKGYALPSEILKIYEKLELEDLKELPALIRSKSVRSLMRGKLFDASKVLVEFDLKSNMKCHEHTKFDYILKRNDLQIVKHENPDETNSALIVSYSLGYSKPLVEKWDKIRAMASIMSSIVHETFFDELRTQEQLGYIVQVRLDTVGHVAYPNYVLKFVVQSNLKDALFLNDRVKKFVNDFTESLDTFSEETFLSTRKAIYESLIEKEKTWVDTYARELRLTSSQDYLWDNRQRLASSLSKFGLEEFKSFWKNIFEEPICSVGVEKL